MKIYACNWYAALATKYYLPPGIDVSLMSEGNRFPLFLWFKYLFAASTRLIMRRFICATLLIALCLQSTGAAAVGLDGTNVGATLAQVRIDFQSVSNWFIQSPTLAMILTPDRYAAMHAPAPTRVVAPRADASKTRLQDVQRPVSRGPGVRGTPPEMRKRPLLLKDAEKLQAPAVTPPPNSAASNARAALTSRAPTIDFSLPKPAATPTISFSLPTLAPGHPPVRTSGGIHAFDVTTSSPNTTGINPWWTYEEGALPGTGKYMVNVGNGNLIVQSDDIDIPERGIDLAFRRTYNSGSLNDTNANSGNDDGSPNENVYGNGWTNTFDAHVAANTSGGISVFDIDGARYDYTPNGTGCLTPPAGMHDYLCTDGYNNWVWLKKSGTFYYFFGTNLSQSIAGLSGRLYGIYARNFNNNILFSYYWANGDASSSNNLTQIVAGHSDGQQLVLSFGMVNGRPLLSSITRPDGAQVIYLYDTAHELATVARPGNNVASSLSENYGYYGGSKLAWTSNPRWNYSGGAEGSFTNFYYDASSRVNGVLLYGTANFAPNDGTGAVLQPGYATGANTIAHNTLTYPTSGETTLTDSDGHANTWLYDSIARVTQTKEWTGSLWLVTNTSWDASNNLAESVDARGNATDFAYDPNGNQTAMALPVLTTSQGTFRPTILTSYDQYNNVTSFCDANHTQSLGLSWTSPPAMVDSLCPGDVGSTRLVWIYPSYEPYGELSTALTAATASAPSGYTRYVSYDASNQGGVDYGLPTSITGTSFTQADGNTRTPTQRFHYDSHGNIDCSAQLADNSGVHWWLFEHDSLNRAIKAADPDDASSTNGACPRTSGISGSRSVITTSYYPNGEESASQTPSEYAAGVSTTSAYDADGNLTQQTDHTGGALSQTDNWYDGADRLVEVKLPHDSRTLPNGSSYEYYSYSWMTRYLYDLSQSNTVSFYGGAFRAYGNKFQTQEYLGTQSSANWIPVNATSYDALNRTVTAFRTAVCGNGAPSGPDLCSATITQATNGYDGSGLVGLRSSYANAANQISTFTYDNANRLSAVGFSDSTPGRQYTYDPDGNIVTVTSARFGTQSYVRDGANNITSVSEAQNGGVTLPAILSYAYYPDSSRSSITVSSEANPGQALFSETMSYRGDGKQTARTLSINGTAYALGWTYTPAGRPLTFADPFQSNAKSTAYDSYARSSGVYYPGGQFNAFAFTPEGQLSSRQAANTGDTPYTQAFLYNTRGELLSDSAAPLLRGSHSGPGQQSANGVLLPQIPTSWDARNSVLLSSTDPAQGLLNASSAWSYDAAGRQVSDTEDSSYSFTYLDPENGEESCLGGAIATATRQYDAEDHLVRNSSVTQSSGANPQHNPCPQEYSSSTETTNYGWGAAGHPVITQMDGISTQPESLHWDGDELAFTSITGTVDAVYLGSDAIWTPNGSQPIFSVTDRDYNGMQIHSHNSGGAMAIIQKCSPFQLCQAAGYSGSVNEPRTDGIHFQGTGDIIQGVRAYSTNTAQWMSPDALAGDDSDPLSQQAYMWNGNDPNDYADPSGYSDCKTFDPKNSGCTIKQEIVHCPDCAQKYTEGLERHAAELRDLGNAPKMWFGAALSMLPFGPGEKVAQKAAEVATNDAKTFLYQKVSATGAHLKYGITKNPLSRYTSAQLAGGQLRILASGSRPAMLTLERSLHRTLPLGPEEGQTQYQTIQQALGLKP